MKSDLRPAFVLFAVLTFICGVLYPFAITAIGQIFFADKAAGSLMLRDGEPIGSTLIGQSFSSPKYLLGTAFRYQPDAEQRGIVGRLKSRSHQSRSDRCGKRTY